MNLETPQNNSPAVTLVAKTPEQFNLPGQMRQDVGMTIEMSIGR
jgi:hypothetical protein